MNETPLTMLQQNSSEEVKRKKGTEKGIHQIRLSMKKYLKRNSSYIHHRGNATVWPKYQIVRAAMKKKMMALPVKFARPLG